jgi:hypothetical protein
MPQLGLGLRANVSGISFYDGDAAAYFTRAGVTDATAKAQINAFVKGTKDLGLWNNMVSWPLRSTQNAGTGTTAYSLGGLITTNGTLTNGPTWGTDGVTFDGTNDHIRIPFSSKSSYSNFNYGGVFMASLNDGVRIAIQSNQPWTGVQFSTMKVSDDGALDISLGSYTLNTTFLSSNYDKNGTTVVAYRDGSSRGTATSLVGLNSADFYIGSYTFNALFWGGTISIGYFFSRSLTATENANFYSLYKTTLGTGLGLP